MISPHNDSFLWGKQKTEKQALLTRMKLNTKRNAAIIRAQKLAN